MWARVLFGLKALSDYILRSTTMRNTIFDRCGGVGRADPRFLGGRKGARGSNQQR